ncbi:DUF1810 domain-containing protein [Sphingomonas sp.]|uniref:DUF1810 domain-containing protein n=1 Tax=Sphingomonas sp. TaxID=28214 RepID=UPI0025F5C26F|nr:DUF1810 domain-containing protein [Sphingomonas sp.]
MLDAARFLDAQADSYAAAFVEISAGRKRSHWMWFVFPQISGLGRSATAQRCAIASIGVAREYLAHPVLGLRLRECVAALQDLPPTSAVDVFGPVDAMKLRSSLTLFIQAGAGLPFEAALARWFGGEVDAVTLTILNQQLAA